MADHPQRLGDFAVGEGDADPAHVDVALPHRRVFARHQRQRRAGAFHLVIEQRGLIKAAKPEQQTDLLSVGDILEPPQPMRNGETMRLLERLDGLLGMAIDPDQPRMGDPAGDELIDLPQHGGGNEITLDQRARAGQFVALVINHRERHGGDGAQAVGMALEMAVQGDALLERGHRLIGAAGEEIGGADDRGMKHLRMAAVDQRELFARQRGDAVDVAQFELQPLGIKEMVVDRRLEIGFGGGIARAGSRRIFRCAPHHRETAQSPSRGAGCNGR